MRLNIYSFLWLYFTLCWHLFHFYYLFFYFIKISFKHSFPFSSVWCYSLPVLLPLLHHPFMSLTISSSFFYIICHRFSISLDHRSSSLDLTNRLIQLRSLSATILAMSLNSFFSFFIRYSTYLSFWCLSYSSFHPSLFIYFTT